MLTRIRALTVVKSPVCQCMQRGAAERDPTVTRCSLFSNFCDGADGPPAFRQSSHPAALALALALSEAKLATLAGDSCRGPVKIKIGPLYRKYLAVGELVGRDLSQDAVTHHIVGASSAVSERDCGTALEKKKKKKKKRGGFVESPSLCGIFTFDNNGRNECEICITSMSDNRPYCRTRCRAAPSLQGTCTRHCNRDTRNGYEH